MTILYGFLSLIIFGLFFLFVFRIEEKDNNWRSFEKMVYNDMKTKHTNVKLGKGIKDGGIDVTGRRGKYYIAVQCKAYRKASIGVKTCRELIGSIFDRYENIENVIPVLAVYKKTKFTKEANMFCISNNIRIWKY